MPQVHGWLALKLPVAAVLHISTPPKVLLFPFLRAPPGCGFTGLKCWENHLSCRQKVNFVLLTGPGKAKTVATSSNIDWRPFSKSIKAVKPHSNETASFRDLLQISL